MSAIDLTKPCIQAPGYRNSDGYAYARMGNREIPAHRKVYIDIFGPIPQGHTIDHLCHNDDSACPGDRTCLHRGCIQPAHLDAVEHRTNVLRGSGPPAKHARQTHCLRGHEFTPENTYRPPREPNTRQCRACSRLRATVAWKNRTRPAAGGAS